MHVQMHVHTNAVRRDHPSAPAAATRARRPVTTPLDRVLRGRFVLAEVTDGGDLPAELARAQRPPVADLVDAVAVLGAFPDGSYSAGAVRVSLLTL